MNEILLPTYKYSKTFNQFINEYKNIDDLVS